MNYDLENSFVIGDRMTDVQLAKNMGCQSISKRPKTSESGRSDKRNRDDRGVSNDKASGTTDPREDRDTGNDRGTESNVNDERLGVSRFLKAEPRKAR